MRHFVILFTLIGIVGMLLVPVNLSHGLPSFLNCKYDSDYIISTNKLEFVPGETFVVNARTILDDPSFEMIVINPKGQEVFADVIDADDNNYAQNRFHIPDDAQKGTWSVFLTANPSHLQEVIFIGVDETPQPILSIKPSFVNHKYKVEDASFLIAGEPNTDVQVTVLDPNSEKTRIYIVALPSQGKCNFTLDLDGYKPGVYDVEIRNNDGVETTRFTVGLQPSRGVIDIRMSSDPYFSGDAVFLLGDTAANTNLTVEVFDPSENVVNQFFTTSDETGMISTSFHLPDDAIHGTWKVKASSSPNFDSIEFTVIEKMQNMESSNKILESPDEIQECSWEKNLLSQNPHSRYALCELQQCEETPTTVKERTRAQMAEQKVTLENDYIVQQFLRKHPEATIEGAQLDIVNTKTPITWKITTPHDLESSKATNAGKLYVNFDSCSYITGYLYDVTDWEGDGTRATYRYGDTDPEQIATFEEKKYQLAETIMERHMPPRIQINEFNIQPDKIRCNEGLILIQKHDGTPACVKPDTASNLAEREWSHPCPNGRFNEQRSICPVSSPGMSSESSLESESQKSDSQKQTVDVIIPLGAVIEGNENLIPEEVTVVLGKNSTVTWINQDDTAHTLRSDYKNNPWWTGLLRPGESSSVTFNSTGIFSYHGTPGPWISGAVIVIPAEYDESKLPSSDDYDFQRMHMHNACTKERSFCFGVFENGTQVMVQCDFPIHGCGPVLFDDYVEVGNED